MNQDCTAGRHQWAKTSLWLEREGGGLMTPCQRPDCDAEIIQRTTQSVVHGPGMSINGMRLDIEDDEVGGVAKVVCREAARDYKIPLPLGAGDVVLDIGAHVGIVGIYLAKRYPGIRVLAFEPVGQNYERMVRNVRTNVAPGIETHPMAVTADGRPIRLNGDVGSNTGGMSMLVADGASAEVAPSLSIADIFTMFQGRCALLKIDCEGAEYEILEAAGDLLSRVDHLRGEFHVNGALESQGKSIEGLIALCRRYIPGNHVQVTHCRMGD